VSQPVCQQITRKSASNLALALVLLPRDRRQAMAALYAFCRQVDDVADEDLVPLEDRRRQLRLWREDIRATFRGDSPTLPVNRELQPFLARYALKLAHFEELLTGVEMDLDIQRYATQSELDTYCYRVASVVGLLSIEVFGYQDPACQAYAVELGHALQLTNILRDVRVDAERGRIYLPQEDLARFGIKEADILAGRFSGPYAALAREMGGRARSRYAKARNLLPAKDRRAMIAAELMGAIYWRLLQKLEARAFDVFQPGIVRLSSPHKLALILQTWWRVASGTSTPAYGGS
jgi:phytoene synthase